MKFSNIIPFVFTLTASVVNAQSFCNNAKHSGQSVRVTSNKVGSIGNVGYELWADSGSNSATFYEDGSFSCSFQRAKDYLCRAGLSFDSTKTHQQIGHMYADFKLVKQNIQSVDYSYVGIYGWTRNPLIEFYVVDNWLSQGRPGDWVGNKRYGDYNIDGAVYTVYENTRYNAPSIDGNTTFKQIFSIRKQARDCGTIDITAHFEQWEKLGMKLGKMHEAKVLGEAGSVGGGTSGTADFPYAKVYIGNKPSAQPTTTTKKTTTTTRKTSTKTLPTPKNNCSPKIVGMGYQCCSANCEIVYTDEDGTWGYENDEWCGCYKKVTCVGAQGYPCCVSNTEVYFTDEDGDWSLENDDWCIIRK